MPNPYFRFKQFTVYQDRCTLRVCTDACILGAWFAGKVPVSSRVLDIGSGTGLLMLMLAQRHNGGIDGIELDQASFGQLTDNLANSKWADRLNAFSGDARNFIFSHKYNFIISNPPFFEGDLPSLSGRENMAKHSKELTLAELLDVIDANLDSSGSFGILLPYHRMDYFEELASDRRFYLRERLLVRQTPRHAFFRVILHFSRNGIGNEPALPAAADLSAAMGPAKNGLTTPAIQELTIKDNDNRYTVEFEDLMRDYYLYL